MTHPVSTNLQEANVDPRRKPKTVNLQQLRTVDFPRNSIYLKKQLTFDTCYTSVVPEHPILLLLAEAVDGWESCGTYFGLYWECFVDHNP